MTKWEYAVGQNPTPRKVDTWVANGEAIAPGTQIDMLNRMGELGWEMTGLFMHPMGSPIIYFKRPTAVQ